MMDTYAWERLRHASDDSDVPRVDLRSSHLLVVDIEPQVVGAIGSQVMLVTAEVNVPHVVFFINL